MLQPTVDQRPSRVISDSKEGVHSGIRKRLFVRFLEVEYVLSKSFAGEAVGLDEGDSKLQ